MNPVATYRIQLNKDFKFTDCQDIISYLKKLNISHLYLSPILESTTGSNHGYDATDFAKISEERGGYEQLYELIDAAKKSGLNIILDIVPNHMAAHPENSYWQDILQKGPQSKYYPLFDIKADTDEKLRLPVLGDTIETALKKDEIKLSVEGDKVTFLYSSLHYPLNEESRIAYQSGLKDLKALLDMQFYELVYWADQEKPINYRRFFDVTGLAGLRIEDQEIFDLAHKLIFKIVDDHSNIEGVRIDHIDGLVDPKGYLDGLTKKIPNIWIEKILSGQEKLISDWATLGTTGYEFIEHINQLMVNKEGFSKIERFWQENCELKWKNFQSCVFDSKREVLKILFEPELNRLVSLTTTNPNEGQEAEIFWSCLTVALPVYRIYDDILSPDDAVLKEALEIARENGGDAFLKAEKKYLPLFLNPSNDDHEKAIIEWKQLSGPAMAKGLEDTSHYRYTPLAALNEVGCEAHITDNDKNTFFNWLAERSRNHPLCMNATSTHDTKRSEDARHRLYALADIPEEWIDFYQKVDAFQPSPLPFSTKYMIHQAIISVWPLNNQIDEDFIERIHAYTQKAFREQKLYTKWTAPSEEFETNISDFINSILRNDKFLSAMNEFMGKIAIYGALNSLSVLTLKILNHGLPDFYQGSEKWEFTLVDPDNRRNIDYLNRKEIIKDSQDLSPDDLLKEWRSGTIKLWATQKLLGIRKEFLTGSQSNKIRILNVVGKYSQNVIAYMIRQDNNCGIIVACPRYSGKLGLSENLQADWQDTKIALPEDLKNSKFIDLIREEHVDDSFFNDMNSIFKSFPVSVISFGNKSS